MKFTVTILIFYLFLLGNILTSFSQSQQNDNEKVELLITKKRTYNKSHSFGYRIQLFNGDEKAVKEKRKEFNVEFPDIKTYRIYNPPEWKIQVGHFKTKLAADQFLISLKKQFPSAIVVPLAK